MWDDDRFWVALAVIGLSAFGIACCEMLPDLYGQLRGLR